MAVNADYIPGRYFTLASKVGPAVLRRGWPQYSTNRIEQFLLMITIAMLPLQDHIPSVAGFSIMFILFGVLACYVLANRSKKLARTWAHPLFLATYAFLFLGYVIESFHPYSSYSDILRMAQMIAGAVFVASLCRDQHALRTAVYGYIVAGVFMAGLLFLTSYGALSQATATDFREADRIRSEVFSDNPLQADLNGMAFIAGQATIVALALALTSCSVLRRNLFLGISLFCFIATFLPLSRGGIAMVIVSCATVLFAYGAMRPKTILMVGLIGVSSLIWIPDAAWERMAFSTGAGEGGRMEARARVYTAFVKHLPEYVMGGVGAGNFWEHWGHDSQFASGKGVSGAHNAFFQVTIYWGVIALLGLLVIAWKAYCCLPKRCGDNGLALSLVGIAASLLLFSLSAHPIYAKEYALGFGLLAGSRLWIWPKGIVPPASRPPGRVRLPFRQAS